MIATAVIGMVVQAENEDKSAWRTKAQELFSQAQGVQLDGTRTGVKEEEKGTYKIEYTDGRVVCTDATPESSENVRSVHKRTQNDPQVVKVSGGQKVDAEVWTSLHKVDGSYKELSDVELAKADDKNFDAWMTHVARVDGYAKAHAEARKALETVRTARKGDDQSKVQQAQTDYASQVSKLKRLLKDAGEKLGVGGQLWSCEEASLRVATVDGEKAADQFRSQRRDTMTKLMAKLS